MRFADPLVCPDCRAALEGRSRCPRCGLDLTDGPVRELWQTLLRADDLLATATARRDRATAPPPPTPTPAPTTAPRDGAADPYPQFPAPPPPTRTDGLPPTPPPERPQRSWSVGTVLLGLGALGLVVAAIIFVSRSWDSIGLVGKALVLAAATAAATAAAVWATRRPLRASAEALWAVALALALVDLLGARGEGLFGLDGVPWSWIILVSGALLAVAGAAVVRWARPLVGAELVVPAVASIAGVGLAATGTAQISELGDFWGAFAGLVVAGLLGLALRFSGSGLIAVGSRVVVGVFFVVSAGLAVAEAGEHPSISELVGDAHGVPLLLMSAAALAVAATVPVARRLFTAVAVVGVGLLVIIPTEHAWSPEGAWVAIAALTVVTAAAGALASSDWIVGVRAATALGMTFLLGLALSWAAAVVHAMGQVSESAVRLTADDRVDTWLADFDVSATVVCAAAVVVVALLVSRWPVLGGPGLHGVRLPVLLTAVSLSAVGVVLAFEAPWWALASALAAAALLAAAVGQRFRSPWTTAVAGVVAVPALTTALVSPSLTAGVWLVLAMAIIAISRLDGPLVQRSSASALAVPIASGGVFALLTAVGGTSTVTCLGTLLIALVGLAVAIGWPAPPRVFLEAGAAAAVLVTATTADSTALGAAAATLIGVTLCAIAMSVQDRRVLVWPGVAAFVIAYVLLVIDSGFDFVEAYTLPLAAALLAGGVALAVKRPQTHSWIALGPGLALGLLPSLPQALADPTGLRALLLGLASVVVLGVGARFSRQAPFVLGAIVAALVVLFNIGPYANAAPRVVVIAVVSVVLVGLGVTWEDRVRDGRRVMAFVKDMR